jgi:hypothetical protein
MTKQFIVIQKTRFRTSTIGAIPAYLTFEDEK